MRRLIFVAAAVVLVLPAEAWCRQEQQQSQPSQTQPSQTQQSSAPQGQTQSKPQSPAPQDSLAEAARKAREQKKEAPKAAKVFTNDNIPTEGGISSVGKPAEAAPAANQANATSTAQAAASGENSATPSNDEKTWRDRFAKLHHKLDQDQADLDLMQRELAVLNTQYYSDPMKGMQQGLSRDDINKKTADIEAKKKQVEDDKKAIADAEDELRKSGGDPGWASQ
jgi:hypothetical protein